MTDEIILYDLASKHGVSWSPNAWKTRLLLNFKSIQYRTEWLEYPDLEPTFKAFGILPNGPGAFAAYSSPTIWLPDGTYVMDSERIADKLESLYPSPALHLETDLHRQAGKVCREIIFAEVPNFMAPLVEEWLQEPSKSWFAADREKRLGISVWELQRLKGGDQTHGELEVKLKALQALFRGHKQDEGPFVLGSTVSYADLVLIAMFESFSRTQKDVYDRIMSFDQGFRELHELGKQWTVKEDSVLENFSRLQPLNSPLWPKTLLPDSA